MKRLVVLSLFGLGLINGCSSCADWRRPRAFVCSVDASTPAGTEDPQCGPGWRCGLDERCHAIGEPKPYACATDDDCEAAWRCGPQGLCLDVSDEALRPNAFAGAVRARQISPVLNTAQAEAVASARFEVAAACGPSAPAVSLTFVTDAGTVRSLQFPLGRATDCDSGVELSSLAAAAPMTSPALAAADTSSGTWVLGTGGQLCHFGVTPAGLGGCDGIKLDFAATRLRTGRSATLPVVARSASRYVLLYADAGVTTAQRVLPVSVGAEQVLLDLAPFSRPGGAVGLIAVTERGAFVADVPAGSAPAAEAWGSITLPGFGCSSTAAPPNALGALRDLSWVQGADLLAASFVADAGAFVAVFDGTPAGTGGVRECDERVLEGVQPGTPSTCLACPSGALESYAVSLVSPVEPRYAIESRCREANGALTARVSMLSGGLCSGDVLPAPIAQVSSVAGPTASASAGSAGQLWLQLNPGFSREARFLDRAPSLVLGGTSGTLLAGADPLSVLLPSGTVEVEAAQLFAYRAGEGFVATPSTGGRLLTGVDGTRPWALEEASDAGGGLPPALVALEPTRRRLLGVLTASETFKPPYLAAAQRAPDAGTSVVVVTAFDALLAAEVDDGHDGSLSTAPVFRVRLVPSNRSEISALTLLPRREGVHAEGYVLSGGRLHQFTATNPTVWKSTELELPAGEPVALFHDGARGRVGFKDGRVLSLPGRVPVAPRLAGEDATAFADVCGQVLALAGATAFRLVVQPGDSVGVWEPIALPKGPPGRAVRLHASSDGAFVFFDSGRVVRLEGLVCL